jgi:hypothetical protein
MFGQVRFAKGDHHGHFQTMRYAHKLRGVRRELTLQFRLRASPPVRIKTYTGIVARLSREFIVVEF